MSKDKMDIQIGEALTADFEENTWTFQMSDNFKVRAGEFLIIPKEDINAQLIAATPELLDFLNEFIELGNDCDWRPEDELNELYRIAMKLINKALRKEDSHE